MENQFQFGSIYTQEVDKLYSDLDDDDLVMKIAFLNVSGEQKILEIGDTNITQDHLILSNEFSKYWSNFEKIESMYMLVLGDIADYNSFKKNAENKISEDAKECSDKFNRLIVHILSSGKMFVDFMENYLKRVYGANSEQFKGFKKTLSKEYDQCFEYRFTYGLRNYTQHIEMPLSSIHVSAKDSSRNEEFVVKLMISPKHLLNSGFGWNSALKHDLSCMSGEIDMNQIIEKYFFSITRIYGEINKIYLDSNYDKLIHFRDSFGKIYTRHDQVFLYKITKYNLKFDPRKFQTEPILGLYEIDRIFLKLGKIGLVNIERG